MKTEEYLATDETQTGALSFHLGPTFDPLTISVPITVGTYVVTLAKPLGDLPKNAHYTLRETRHAPWMGESLPTAAAKLTLQLVSKFR